MVDFDAKIKNHMIIVFGATGELMKKKLLPAFYNLYEKGLISQTTPIVCVGRKKLTKNSYIDLIEPEKNIPGVNNMILSGFLQLINYVKADFETGEMGSLVSTIDKLDKKNHCRGNKIFYLATPPYLFQAVSEKIEKTGLLKGKGWKRVVYEKPLGADLKTSTEINKKISKVFEESQVFRVDQFIGRENLQKILSLRFANTIFKECFGSKYIDNLQIIVSRKEGTQNWPAFYDNYGEIREIFYNRILQLLSLIALPEPKSMNNDYLRNERLKVLKSIETPTPKDIVIGQYNSGNIDGKKTKAYRQEEGVGDRSNTETFIATKLNLKRGVLKDTPVYIKGGKRLSKEQERIDVVFKSLGSGLLDAKNNNANILSIMLSPEKGFCLNINTNTAEDRLKVSPVWLENLYSTESVKGFFSLHEEMLYEVMKGEQVAFSSGEELQESWKLTDAIIDKANRKKVKFPNYSAGSEGPKEATSLLKKDKRNWVV